MSGAVLALVQLFGKDKALLREVVLKQSDGGDVAANSGICREAQFYQTFAGPEAKAKAKEKAKANLLGLRVPAVYFAAADAKTGAKAIIMENLHSWVQAGYLLATVAFSHTFQVNCVSFFISLCAAYPSLLLLLVAQFLL